MQVTGSVATSRPTKSRQSKECQRTGRWSDHDIHCCACRIVPLNKLECPNVGIRSDVHAAVAVVSRAGVGLEPETEVVDRVQVPIADGGLASRIEDRAVGVTLGVEQSRSELGGANFLPLVQIADCVAKLTRRTHEPGSNAAKHGQRRSGRAGGVQVEVPAQYRSPRGSGGSVLDVHEQTSGGRWNTQVAVPAVDCGMGAANRGDSDCRCSEDVSAEPV